MPGLIGARTTHKNCTHACNRRIHNGWHLPMRWPKKQPPQHRPCTCSTTQLQKQPRAVVTLLRAPARHLPQRAHWPRCTAKPSFAALECVELHIPAGALLHHLRSNSSAVARPALCNHRQFTRRPSCHQKGAHARVNHRSVIASVVVSQQAQQHSIQRLIKHQLNKRTRGDAVQLQVHTCEPAPHAAHHT
jgi:hypothetical protein